MRYRPIRRNNEFGRVYARGKSYVNQALPLYDALDIRHLDVTALTPRETAECIRREGGA